MTRLLWTLLSILIAGTAVAKPHYLLIPDSLPELSRALQPEQVVYADNELALLQVEDIKIEELALWVHETLKACGGFIDVTEEVSEADSPFAYVWKEKARKLAPRIHSTPQTVTFDLLTGELVNSADGERLWDFLKALTDFPDRSATSQNGKKAADWLQSEATNSASSLSGFSSRMVETGEGFYPQPSLVTTYPGTNPSLPHVVIGGHMDTFTNAKPGADDDGSGTSVVMEVLKTINERGARFEHTIDFIWYAAEERGLVGSKYVVKDFQEKNIPVKAAIQFDMTGGNHPDDSEDIYLITDNTDSGLTATLKSLAETYVTTKVGTTECGYSCSDHANWTRAGIPAVFPFEAAFEHMNDRLHTGNDKIQYLDKDHALRFAKLGLAFLSHMANLKSLRL